MVATEKGGRIRALLQRLERDVLARAAADGGRLPPERALAAELGVSRGTLRRAMAELVRRGVVVRHVGRGTFVRAAATASAPVAVPETSPVEIMEVRMFVEPAAAGIAALRATPEDLARIREAVEACFAAQDLAAFERADAAFHRAVAAAARNNLLLELVARLDAARSGELWGRLKARTVTPERRALYARQHEVVAGAIRDRDAPAARRAMRRHLLEVARHLLGAGLPLD